MGNKGSFRRLRGTAVYLVDAVRKPMPGQPREVRPEGVGFDDACACREVILMNLADKLGTGETELLKASVRRHTALQQECSH